MPASCGRWELLEHAAGDASSMQPFFAQAASDNINVIRAFGHGSTPSLVLQPSPGRQLKFECRPLCQTLLDSAIIVLKCLQSLIFDSMCMQLQSRMIHQDQICHQVI